MNAERKSLGICIGASTIKVAELIEAGGALQMGKTALVGHDCNTRQSVAQILQQFDPAAYDYVCVTGRKFKDLVNLPAITEPEAVERALRWLRSLPSPARRRAGDEGGDGIEESGVPLASPVPFRRVDKPILAEPVAPQHRFPPTTHHPPLTPTLAEPVAPECCPHPSPLPEGEGTCDTPHALMSLGSESFILYQLDEAGTIVGVRAGNKCASGTGEFFLQQIARMDLGIEEASRVAQGVEPYSVSGRCSVFCKSDCTHALNKGIPKERVSAGLGNMMAEKVLEILGPLPRNNILLVGGVTRNTYVVEQLRQKLENLVIPQYAEVFEALGAAMYAFEEQTRPSGPVALAPKGSSFTVLPPLKNAERLVTFQQQQRERACDGDETILGLDVGSTTTKAVLMRTADSKVLASVYLRTNGNPIKAARECYQAIHEELSVAFRSAKESGSPSTQQRHFRGAKGDTVKIIALGVTGSGRHIAGLHAQTDGIINEIIAHATAAAFFDPQVDTILEIGGQDAKYTYLVNGVPCDYAMNEACSAGTGSFLEEAAKESLSIGFRDIQDIALRAESPPNFNDQCAAFISSDVKNASHELSRDNIVAGLVYSICMNYNNRVKGSRKVGRKVFMQGGVCYNKAVPLAMASLLEREIIVPPEPGLMGAFGVALEVKQRLAMGLLQPAQFDLRELAAREVAYGKTFTCPGTQENCDRGCQINVIKLDGKSLPFGGICNKYYNATHHVAIDPQPYEFVTRRQQAVFAFVPPKPSGSPKTVGLTRSFLTNLLYPLYSHFFSALGFAVVLSDAVDPEGIKRTCSSFCFPVEIAHGMLMNLVRKEPDYIFLPEICELYVEKNAERLPGRQSTCITVQAEPFILRSAFRELEGRVISPSLNWYRGWHSMKDAFVDVARQLGCGKRRAAEAFSEGVAKLEEFFERRRELGRDALRAIEADPERVGIVLFGRPYNAFAQEANMGIPRKFASRGVYCVPFDCLPFHDELSQEKMTWAMGHDLTRAARFVKKHPQLFGAFLTNFGCGPDSFVVGYFRDIMKTKPSLTLEIDSHTADAGVNTRIEAFLDIIDRYRKLGIADPPEQPFRKAQFVLERGKSTVIASDGTRLSVKDPRVKVLMPSMGRTLSEVAVAAMQGLGMRAEAVPLPDFKTLMQGRANTSCKECLPLILTTGSMIDYVEQQQNNGQQGNGDVLLYFMPTTNGNCRFPQYNVFLNRLIEKRRIENLVTFTLSSENGYGGMGSTNVVKLLKAIVVGDVMDDVKNALAVLAHAPDEARHVFCQQWQSILDCFSGGCRGLYPLLRSVADRLAAIPRKCSLAEAKRVLIAGEIFVRKDEFSSQRVVEALARRGIVAQRSPMLEWMRYIDYWVQYIDPRRLSLSDRLRLRVRTTVFGHVESKIKRILATSGLCDHEVTDIKELLDYGTHFVDKTFGGETVLVIGRFFKGMLEEFHGLISIGPFACLPTRIIESILTPESRAKGNDRLLQLPGSDRLRSCSSLPFLSIECDGNPFPQVIEAQLEAFCLQVERLHAASKGPLKVSHLHDSTPSMHGRGDRRDCRFHSLPTRRSLTVTPGE